MSKQESEKVEGETQETLEQREMSDKLKNMATDLEGSPKPEKEDSEKKFSGRAAVNGVEISVGWDDGYDDYTIYFPQIELGEDSSEKGVHDQVIRISEDPEKAKAVFEYAKTVAESNVNVLEVFLEVEKFCNRM